MEGIRAVAWDLDGVIVDSGEAHRASWMAMAREWDVPYDADNDFINTFGRRNNEIISLLWGVTDIEVMEKMALCKEEYFRHEAHLLKPLPGVIELINALKGAGWKQGIGSSAPLKNIEVLLEATGLSDKMDCIASGDDVTEGKPDPQVFLLAFKRLGVEPKYGIVVEDAPAGVRAGKSAGAAVVGVTNSHPGQALHEAGADLVVKHLTQVSVEALEELVQANRP